MKEFINCGIHFTFVKLNNKCDEMLETMKKSFKNPLDLGLIDLPEPPVKNKPK